ncbi:SigE family RNA polymerase sigma factor [Yinghuangia seranimata]|uniref:SigE family RNA polymerase sigma factor n=1 Tax=Yinghuangia seranimata TaxID=408067 RepID=UPI00248AB5E7|nr:SigE family RNA polymerase sigma factor [Yinghuangia seranimata]MDI2130301.1 SigE family RNA polymerase sigma factor [Yinghuangia seranimata]
MKRDHDRAFDDFVVARGAALRRTAYLLCGDWHHAEDLVQHTMTQVYSRWHRVRDPSAMNAYARKILVRAYVDTTRKRSSTETATGALPDVEATAAGDPDTRVALMAALDRMTPAYRAVLVLRFWEDQSIEQTAALLNKNAGSVRSATTRGLEQLRAILGDQLADLTHA